MSDIKMQIKLEPSEIMLLERVNEPRIRKRKLHPSNKTSKHPRIDESCLSSEDIAKKSSKCPDSDPVNRKSSKLKYFLVLLIVGVTTVMLSQIEWSQCGLWATYNNNFNKIVHGDERYCHRDMDPSVIVVELKRNLVNQNDAIKLIHTSLKLVNREKFISIAFSGSIGVGKTLSSNIIAENFKWQGNVNQLIYELNFDTSLKVNESLELDFDVASSEFSHCGFNLIIIDDVPVKQSAIERIIQLEKQLSRVKAYKIVFIVIFKGEVSQNDLQHFVIVDFEPFTRESFNECIDRHLHLFNVKLSPAKILELQSVNFHTFGCKTVGKRISKL